MDNWIYISKSQYPWENEAIEYLKAHLPTHEPYRGWSNFEFIAEDGSINEVDALVLTPVGLFLIEIKSRPGELLGDVRTWKWRHAGREKVSDNPIFLTNRKAKKLKSLLGRQKAFKDLKVPFIEALVFCSDPDLQVRLPSSATQRICIRDAGRTTPPSAKLPAIMDALCRRDGLADPARQPINAPLARTICRALEQAGVRPGEQSRMAGEFRLLKLLYESPQETFQDWLVEHPQAKSVRRRARIYLIGAGTTAGQRESIVRAARRELETGEILARHPKILRANGFRDMELGPVLDFDFAPDEVSLDHFLNSTESMTGFDIRLAMVRQLAETLRFAHDKRVFHGALSPQSILVTPVEKDHAPTLRIGNWQTSTRAEHDTKGNTRMTGTVHKDLFWEDPAPCYIAPEVLHNPLIGEDAARSADIFSLGAVAFHILTGSPPASHALDLAERLQRERGLRMSSAQNGIPEALDDLIMAATRPEVSSRVGTAEEFLRLLDIVEEELTRPESPSPANPLDAHIGDSFPDGWTVKARLGSGSTAVAYLVARQDEEAVLKVSNRASHNERIRVEFETLQKLNHRGIVRAFDSFEVSGLRAFTMQKAGDKTLAQRLRADGPLSLEYLTRFGDELLDIVHYLADAGVSHRDIKPENLGIGSVSGGGKVRLMLFDFSLSKTPLEDIRAGTTDYLDPFLQSPDRKRWDLYAERFAAAITLYEMATGRYPVWSTDGTPPTMLNNEASIETELFDPAVRDTLTRFFKKAFKRDFRQRFDNAEEMQKAWRLAFRGLDQPAAPSPATVADDQIVPDTPVSALGMSASARSAMDRLGAITVRDLLAVPLRRIERIPGFKIRLEIRNKVRTLSARFPPLSISSRANEVSDTPDTLEPLSAQITRFTASRPPPDGPILNALFNLDVTPPSHWQNVGQLAQRLHVNETAVENALRTTRANWTGHMPGLTRLRTVVSDILRQRGGVLSGPALAEVVLITQGSSEAEPRRGRLGAALVRAAAETEAGVQNPRFRIYWRQGVPLVATSDALADYAEELGRRADELALLDPLPNERRILETLRGIPPPNGSGLPLDTDLVNLAASASLQAAASPRNELYPRGMSAIRALKLSQNSLSSMRELTATKIRERVQARYPLAQPLPNPPELDALLLEAGLDLVWHPELQGGSGAYRYRAFDEASASTGTILHPRSATAVALPPPSSEPSSDVAEAILLEKKLRNAEKHGAFLVLAAPPAWIERARMELGKRFDLDPRDGDALMISSMRQSAIELDVDWNLVLAADAASPDSQDGRYLRLLARKAADRVEPALESARTALLANPGLFARYDLMDVFQRWQNRIGRADGKLHGLWVLVPTDAQHGLPTIEGRPFPVIGSAQWAFINDAWLTNRHRSQ